MGMAYGNQPSSVQTPPGQQPNPPPNDIKANGAPAGLDQQSPFQDQPSPPGQGSAPGAPQPPPPGVQTENTPSPNQTPDASMMQWRTGSNTRQLGDPHVNGTDTQPGSALNSAILGQPPPTTQAPAQQPTPPLPTTPSPLPPVPSGQTAATGGMQTAGGTPITNPTDPQQIQQAIHDAGVAQGRSAADLASTADRDMSYWTAKIQADGGLSPYWLQRLRDPPGQGSNSGSPASHAPLQSAISSGQQPANNPQAVIAAVMAQLQQQQQPQQPQQGSS